MANDCWEASGWGAGPVIAEEVDPRVDRGLEGLKARFY